MNRTQKLAKRRIATAKRTERFKKQLEAITLKQGRLKYLNEKLEGITDTLEKGKIIQEVKKQFGMKSL